MQVDHGRTGCFDPTKSPDPAASSDLYTRHDVPVVHNFFAVSIPRRPPRTEPFPLGVARHERQPGHPDSDRDSTGQARVLDPVARGEHPAEQRVQDGRVAGREGGVVHRGRLRAHLSPPSVRPVSQAPGGGAAHGVHQAEAPRDHASGVQRRAGPHPPRARRHPTRGQPL